jgi:hypothetical protein
MGDARTEWLAGDVDSLRLGGYGGVVHLEITSSGGVRVRVPSTRRQKKLGRDTPGTRRLALTVADGIVDRRAGGKRAAARQRPSKTLPGILTPRDIWLGLLRPHFTRLPHDILEWGRADLDRYYASLDAEGRASIPTTDTLNNILVAARALDRRGVVPLDCDFFALRTANMTGQLTAWVLEGTKASTVATYWRRFRWAVLEHQDQRPQHWQRRMDPTTAVKRPKRRGGNATEVQELSDVRLLRQLRADGEWQATAAFMVIAASGRRIGAVAGHRAGLHMDAPPLTANDFARDTGGKLRVTWRADVSKGANYGRGDEVQLCPRQLQVVFRWLTRCHPNPKGAAHPLIWDEQDPTRAASYDALTRAFATAWERAFGKPKPAGVAWHAVIRETVTTLTEEASALVAAEQTGRTLETVMRRYVLRRPEHQEQAVKVLDRRRRALKGSRE